MLEDHAIYFIEKWKIRSGVYDGQGGESIHNEFRQFKITYCLIQPASRGPESAHQESKAFKSKINFVEKRKSTL